MPNEKNMPEAVEALDTVEDIKRAIEAILFAAGYPVKYEKLSEVIGLSPRDIRGLVESMAREYDGRGIQILLYPDTCQLTTKEVFAPYIREALGIKRGGNLSASSLEVLAVVAYNQPVTRSFVDTVRGVDSSYAVTSLWTRISLRQWVAWTPPAVPCSTAPPISSCGCSAFPPWPICPRPRRWALLLPKPRGLSLRRTSPN